MKRHTVLASVMLAGLCTMTVAAYQQAPAPMVVEAEKVKDNLYVMKGGGGNSAVFIGTDGVTVVEHDHHFGLHLDLLLEVEGLGVGAFGDDVRLGQGVGQRIVDVQRVGGAAAVQHGEVRTDQLARAVECGRFLTIFLCCFCQTFSFGGSGHCLMSCGPGFIFGCRYVLRGLGSFHSRGNCCSTEKTRPLATGCKARGECV